MMLPLGLWFNRGPFFLIHHFLTTAGRLTCETTYRRGRSVRRYVVPTTVLQRRQVEKLNGVTPRLGQTPTRFESLKPKRRQPGK